MKTLKFFLLGAVLALFSAGPVLGGDSSSQVVSFDFQQINEFSVTGSPNLNISSTPAGQEPAEVTDSSSACAVTTNGTNKRITARIDAAMPAHTTLKVSVAAPPGSGSSQGFITLTTSASNVVTGISHAAGSNCTVTYKMIATVQAGVLPTDTRTVTFTLSD